MTIPEGLGLRDEWLRLAWQSVPWPWNIVYVVTTEALCVPDARSHHKGVLTYSLIVGLVFYILILDAEMRHRISLTTTGWINALPLSYIPNPSGFFIPIPSACTRDSWHVAEQLEG